MATTPPAHTWTCPSCGRRVPLRAEACHCGTTRARAEEIAQAAVPAPVAARRPASGASDGRAAVDAMTTDVKLLVGALALVLVAGLGWLLFGPRTRPYPAVLGYVDAGPPPAPRPSPRPTPPFPMPWWK